MLYSETFPLTLRITWLYPLSDDSSFWVSCVYSYFHQTNQNRSIMSLTSHVSYVSDTFSLYPASFFWVYFHCYHLTYHICLMMSLTMIGLSSGLLVSALFLFSLMNPLVVFKTSLVVLAILVVVSVACGMALLPDRNRVNWWNCSVGCLHTKKSRVQGQLSHRNIMAPKILLLVSKSVL